MSGCWGEAGSRSTREMRRRGMESVWGLRAETLTSLLKTVGSRKQNPSASPTTSLPLRLSLNKDRPCLVPGGEGER